MPIAQGTRSDEDFAKLKENIQVSFVARLKKNIQIQEERLNDETLNTLTREKVFWINKMNQTIVENINIACKKVLRIRKNTTYERI